MLVNWEIAGRDVYKKPSGLGSPRTAGPILAEALLQLLFTKISNVKISVIRNLVHVTAAVNNYSFNLTVLKSFTFLKRYKYAEFHKTHR